VVEPPDLSGAPRGTIRPHEHRRRPSAKVLARRRLVAILLILVVVGAGVWAATAAVDKTKKAAPPPPPPTTTAVRPKTFRVIFPEGFTRTEMAARITAVDAIARRKRGFEPAINARAYRAATASSPLPAKFAGDRKRRSLEGFLFPAAYDLFQDDPAKALVRKQLDAFQAGWAHVSLRYARSKNLTPYDVLIIASMVEKEAVVDSERPLVAAVIYNRLHAGMPLAIDATIRYALHVPGTKALTESELKDANPYNTRLHTGLPPTPIANPGLPSIMAAAHPAKVDYLYFVAKPDKKHHFFTADPKAFEEYLAAHGYGPHP
jgi:peptidoglycan lytic transglycosylase G